MSLWRKLFRAAKLFKRSILSRLKQVGPFMISICINIIDKLRVKLFGYSISSFTIFYTQPTIDEGLTLVGFGISSYSLLVC
jgi:hypothetical protein